MNRVYLPILPLPVLAVIVAVSACSKARTEEALHVIPPPAALAAATAATAAPAPSPSPAPTPATLAAATPAEEPPSADDVKEFHRSVRK